MIIMFQKSNNERKGSAIASVKLLPPHPHHVDYPKVESRVEYTIDHQTASWSRFQQVATSAWAEIMLRSTGSRVRYCKGSRSSLGGI